MHHQQCHRRRRDAGNAACLSDGFGFVLVEQAVGRILVSDATIQNVGFKNPTYDYDAARE